jgi:hypothetical protein
MGSSCPSKRQIFDELRRVWVAATPEEVVRQALLQQMVKQLGYPKELLVVEREISQLPHLVGQKLPERRLDILCFGREIHPQYPLYPLLLIECKSDNLCMDAEEQLLGYNSFVGAYFIAMAAKDQVLFGYRTKQEKKGAGFTFLPYLPPHAQLLDFLKNVRTL